ncbi:hypothetical protein H0W32_00870 [Patescibacteria group bacterium]|nr:hypothetical protein [Patescibacteria group bacterium]
MKKMTCRDMGGICEAEMSAATPGEMMKMGGDHVNQMAATDPAHAELKTQMDGAMTDKAAMEAWQVMFQENWEKAPQA